MVKKRPKTRSKSKKAVKKTVKRVKKKKVSSKEHVRKISYDYKKRSTKHSEKSEKTKHPLGIKVLTGYLSVILLFYLFYLFLGIKSPIAVIFGQVIEGLTALIMVMVISVIILILIAGLVKRKKWSYHLALVWFVFGVGNSIVSLFLLQPEVASFTKGFLILASITVLVIDLLAIWYIASEKKYFFAKHFAEKKTRVVDKVFVTALILFLLGTLSIGSVMGYDFYVTNVEQTDKIILELDGLSYEDQMNYCNALPGQEKDLCLLILSIKTRGSELCSQIDSDFYKFSCLQA